MKYILLLLLTGCATVPDVGIAEPVQIPELPAQYLEAPEPLPKLTDNSFEALQRDAFETDIKYNILSNRYIDIVEIYNCVRETVNKKGDTKTCFE